MGVWRWGRGWKGENWWGEVVNRPGKGRTRQCKPTLSAEQLCSFYRDGDMTDVLPALGYRDRGILPS